MKKMTRSALSRIAFLIAFSSIIFISCEKDPEIFDHQERLQRAADSVRSGLESMISHKVPTLSVLIQSPSGSYFACSAAEGEEKITPDTYFRFASNTKNFTATAILNMYEDGWLRLDDKITDTIPGSALTYVPTGANWDVPYKNDISIRLLLNHGAGVYDVDNDSVPNCNGMSYVGYMLFTDPSHQFSSTELVNQVVINDLKYFAPGEGYHYSNTGYTILGEIISRVYSFRSGTAKTCTDYLYDHVYGPSARVPLPIHFPYLSTDQNLPSPYCCGNIIDPGPSEQALNCSNNMSAHPAEGNGYGTMKALNTYIRSLMRGENVLHDTTVQIMQTSVNTHYPDYALGTIYITNCGYGHNGAIDGYLSLMLYNPADDVSLVCMMPMWDLRQGVNSFLMCFAAVHTLGKEARKAFSYPG